MVTTYTPDAKQAFALFGPVVRMIPFHALGDQLSYRAEACEVAVVVDDGKKCGVIALGATLPDGTVVALHLNIDAEQARRTGAHLIAAANHLDGASAVQ